MIQKTTTLRVELWNQTLGSAMMNGEEASTVGWGFYCPKTQDCEHSYQTRKKCENAAHQVLPEHAQLHFVVVAAVIADRKR